MKDSFHLRLPAETLATLDRLAKDHDISRTAMIRKALGVLDAADRRPDGHYVGITRDREALTTVILGAR